MATRCGCTSSKRHNQRKPRDGEPSVKLKYGLISVDDHVLEPPHLWTERLSSSTWGERVPHVEQSDAGEWWVLDDQKLPLAGRGSVGAALADRATSPMRWADVPAPAHSPAERLKAMD